MLKAGAATQIITNKLGTPIQGATVNQTAKSIRDELEANVLFLANEKTQIMLASCDVGIFETEWVRLYCKAMSTATGVPERNIIITGTHTHSGPSVYQTSPVKMPDTEWLGSVANMLANAAEQAVSSASECRIGYGKGSAKIGYNRRCCWSDGTHSMHGDTSREDFTGLEGPHDPTHLVLYVEDSDGSILCVVHNNSCHTVNFYGADFYSADYPGYARGLLREALGQIPVLYLNGGFGDNTPRDLTGTGKNVSAEAVVRKQGSILAGETLRLISQNKPIDVSILEHSYEDLSIPVRTIDQVRIEQDREVVEKAMKSDGRIDMDTLLAFGRKRLADDYSGIESETVPVHALRIGDLALATNPCELYGQFMMDVRRRSPTPMTMFSDITDGYSGYCPTMYGVIGGGYSGETIHWTRLAPEAGYLMVDAASKLLHSMWREQS